MYSSITNSLASVRLSVQSAYSPGGSTQHDQHTFRPDNKEDRTMCHSPSVVVDARRVDGKVFQIVGPETAKLHGP